MAVATGDLDRARNLVYDLLRVVSAEAEPPVKGLVFIELTRLLLVVGEPEKAEQVFAEGVDLVAHEPVGVGYLLETLNRDLIPMLERLDLPTAGARMLGKVLAIQKVKENAEVALPLFARLARFYEEAADVGPFFDVMQQAERELRNKPNPRVHQDLLLSRARLFMDFFPERTAEAYRAAVAVAGADLRLLVRGLGQAIKLATEIAYYQDAVDFALIGLTLGPPSDELMEFLLQVVDATSQIGRFDLATQSIDEAIHRLRESDVETQWSPRVWLAAGQLAARMEDARTSLLYLEIGLPGLSKLGQTAPEFLFQLARTYADVGDLLRAEGAFRLCIAISTTAVRRPHSEAACRWALAGLLDYREGWDEAGDERDKALTALGRVRGRYLETSLDLFEMGQWFSVAAEGVEGAMGHCRDFLQTRHPLNGLRLLVTRAQCQAFELLVSKRTESRAADAAPLKETLTRLFAEHYLSMREIEGLSSIGRTLSGLGEQSLALEVLERLVPRVEYARSFVRTARSKALFGSRINGIFNEITNIYLQRGDEQDVLKALAVREANRNRAVDTFRFQVTGVAKEEPGPGDTTEGVRNRLEALRDRMDERGVPQDPEAAARAAIDLLSLKVRGGDPVKHQLEDLGVKPTVISQWRPIPALDLATLQSKLKPSVAVLIYHLSERVSGAWVISRDRVRWRPLQPLRGINEAIFQFRTAVLSPEDVSESRLKSTARTAYKVLVGPFASDIEGKDSLVIIPDELVFGVPFEDLVVPDDSDGGRYLIERYQVSYQLSLTLLQVSHDSAESRTTRPRKLLLVGDPALGEASSPATAWTSLLRELPGASQEIAAVRRAFGQDDTTLYSGVDAKKEVLRKNLEDFTNVHFATHGVVDERFPDLVSFLALSGADGRLTLPEISKLRLSADLVVLSACETGRGRVLGGEGLWGFPAQFLASGARNVVASLWRVEDLSTAALMEEFYRAMTRQPNRYASALRAAKLSLLRNEQWQHPYFWAPFVVYGSLEGD